MDMLLLFKEKIFGAKSAAEMAATHLVCAIITKHFVADYALIQFFLFFSLFATTAFNQILFRFFHFFQPNDERGITVL